MRQSRGGGGGGGGGGGSGGGGRRLTVSMVDVDVAGWRELRVPGLY